MAALPLYHQVETQTAYKRRRLNVQDLKRLGEIIKGISRCVAAL